MESPDDQSRAATVFLVGAVVLTLLFLGLMRLEWVERTLLLPFTNSQADLAEWLGWTRSTLVVVDLSCSGSDVLAMCLGAIAAYPVSIRARLLGAVVGVVLIIAVNTARIGTLWHMAAEKVWFDTMHVYVWPAILMIVVLVYLLAWIGYARRDFHATPHHIPRGKLGPVQLTPRFVGLLAACVVVFVATQPLYLESDFIMGVAYWIATTSVEIALFFGVNAVETVTKSGSAVTMNGNSYLVTQACIITPMIPVGVAVALSLGVSWPKRVAAVLCLGPIFVALGIVRLLILTIPSTLMPAADIVTHAFYQLVIFIPLVVLAAVWRHGLETKAWQRAGLATGCSLITLMIVGSLYTEGIYGVDAALRQLFGSGDSELPIAGDPQGALAMLPAYQLALFMAIWFAAFTGLGWKRFAAAVVLLALSAAGFFFVLSALASVADYVPNVRYLRAWAVVAPILVVAAMEWPLRHADDSRSSEVA